MSYKLFAFTVFFLLSFTASAQSTNPFTNTIRWNATGFIDKNTNASSQYGCQFITYGSSKIDWIQKSGKLTYTISVNSVDGAWSDVNQDGSITYNVTFNDLSGTMTVARSSGVITLILNIAGSSDKINNQYTIANFDIL